MKNEEQITHIILLNSHLNLFRKEFTIEISEENRIKYNGPKLKFIEKNYLSKKKGLYQSLPEDSLLLASLHHGNYSKLENSDLMKSQTKIKERDSFEIEYLLLLLKN